MLDRQRDREMVGWMDGWMRVWCPIKFELICLALPNSDGALALLYDRRR